MPFEMAGEVEDGGKLYEDIMLMIPPVEGYSARTMVTLVAFVADDHPPGPVSPVDVKTAIIAAPTSLTPLEIRGFLTHALMGLREGEAE